MIRHCCIWTTCRNVEVKEAASPWESFCSPPPVSHRCLECFLYVDNRLTSQKKVMEWRLLTFKMYLLINLVFDMVTHNFPIYVIVLWQDSLRNCFTDLGLRCTRSVLPWTLSIATQGTRINSHTSDFSAFPENTLQFSGHSISVKRSQTNFPLLLNQAMLGTLPSLGSGSGKLAWGWAAGFMEAFFLPLAIVKEERINMIHTDSLMELQI